MFMINRLNHALIRFKWKCLILVQFYLFYFIKMYTGI